MEYNFTENERKWREYWKKHDTYKAVIDKTKPKYYVLDMFPYPSGAGLHVGHPLGYIASDIFSRYKTLKGFNVLHPMGYDAFGLPAEQYAIQTGTHPAITTEKNINKYREQLDNLGFSFDWSREVRTSDPKYYKWTQWTFIQLFNSFYCNKCQKARPIAELVAEFAQNGTKNIDAACTEDLSFSADEWNSWDEKKQQQVLMNYRLAYLADIPVNWCPKLGTVLANDEVVDGLSVRGGYPVERKKMRQWSLRITAYAQRLLDGLNTVDFPEPVKDIQNNWIGRSEGASVFFEIEGRSEKMEIFTTRPDTIFGVSFMVIAPEHDLALSLATDEYRAKVEEYVTWAKNRSDVERMAEKKVSGQMTGSYAINPFTKERIPIFIADYVLIGYGTGAIMAVPAHDSRDFAFARHFNLPISQVVAKEGAEIVPTDQWTESFDSKDGILMNSDFLNGLRVKQAIKAMNDRIEEMGIGKRKVNYRLRDAIFSRQRYWGEPFPIYYKDGIPYPLNESKLPLELPEVDKYLPTETGEPPLARAKNWCTPEGYKYETSTMPGFAGSSAYYLRYTDPHNDEMIFSPEAVNYWQNVDLYIGGREHATGHLIYSRFWNKFLFDLGLVPNEEPYKKLINQGMIQGRSNFVYRVSSFEKMAEYKVWQLLKDKKLGVEFKQDYKDGKRRFDFYCDEKKILIEIKREHSLEKVAEAYSEYAKDKGYRILLISIFDVMNRIDVVEQKIKDLVAGGDVPEFEEGEAFVPINLFISKNIPGREEFTVPIHVDINIVSNDILDIEKFRQWRPDFNDAQFVLEDGKYVCGWEIEKMSKSMYNVQNPDDLVERYGADTLRLYEMFLGPVEQAKPWDTNGIEGVARFIKKFWRMFHDEDNNFCISDEKATPAELKTLHNTIKKVTDDIERFSFNTCVSCFMICCNELGKCNKREILEPLCVLISPYAPHIAEELWHEFGHDTSVTKAQWPEYNEAFTKETTFTYPISFNGKMRFNLELPLDMNPKQIEDTVMANDLTKKYTDGKQVAKVIVVPKKIVNIVVK